MCLCLVIFSSVHLQAAQYESSTVLKASQILPGNLLRGPNHQVDERVLNDGFLNTYTINSRYGMITAVSTAKLRKYINEINAIARMDAVKNSDEFKKGIKEKAGDVVEGAKNLAYDPIGTTSNAISGVGKLFSRGKENLFGGSRSESEGSRLQDLSGFSKTKRDYGYEFGVDVYSHNALLQEHLDSIALAGHGGSLAMSTMLMAVPGAAGAAVTVTGGSQLMNKVFRDKAPADLRRMNRQSLSNMVIHADVIDLFIKNAVFTPREQTLLVYALAGMKNTRNRSEFIKFAVLTEDADLAYYRARQAQMYAGYDRNIGRIDSFVTIGEFSTARTKDGKIVFNVPLDYLLWTHGMSRAVSIITQRVNSLKGIKEKHIWITGGMSPLARSNIEKMGWTIQERASL